MTNRFALAALAVPDLPRPPVFVRLDPDGRPHCRVEVVEPAALVVAPPDRPGGRGDYVILRMRAAARARPAG